MRGNFYTSEDKEKVRQMVLGGKSYGEIERILSVPKSTVSTWFSKTVRKPWSKKTMGEHLTRIRKLASAAIKNKWEVIRKEENILIKNKVEEDIKNYPLENIGFYRAMLSMLYWAEGSKYEGASGTKFANTDPNLAKLYITLLRKCYDVDEDKFKIGLYVHYYHSIKETKKFWSKTLNIPQTQFHKVYVKKRSKTRRFRKNFAGICFIYYKDSKIRKELLELGRSLQQIVTKFALVV